MVRRWSAYTSTRGWYGVNLMKFFNVEIYCVITTALWSRDGSAVVGLYIHPRLVWSQFDEVFLMWRFIVLL